MHDPLSSPASSPTVPDLTLERFVLGELRAPERRALEARLADDPRLRERLRMLEASGAAILRETPPEVFARRLRERARKDAVETDARRAAKTSGEWSFRAWKPLLGGLALLTVLAIPLGLLTPRVTIPDAGSPEAETIAPQPGAPSRSAPAPSPQRPEAPETRPAPHEDGIRLKGLEPHLALFRKTDRGAEPLHPGEKVRPGEILRIGYQAAGFPYGAILSVDGNRSVTRHWPATGPRAARLESGEALLPSSFELDAAPAFERFYFVVSDRPFDLDPLLEALLKNEALPEAGEIIRNSRTKNTRVVRFEVLKEDRAPVNPEHGI